MRQSGVLILQPSKFEIRHLYNFLNIAARHVQKVLYVDFILSAQSQGDMAMQKVFSPGEMYKILEGIYKTRTRQMAVDIRVLLEGAKTITGGRPLSQPLDIALLHSSFQSTPGITDTVYSRYQFRNISSSTLQFLSTSEESSSQEVQESNADMRGETRESNELKKYGTVAVGGTFDRIHNGHRLLLSTCCLLSNSRIVVGVSDEPLLANKTLGDLIEPLEVRMRNVEEFIDDIKPDGGLQQVDGNEEKMIHGLIKDIVPLSDPAGPTKTDPDIQCLVVSFETLDGGKSVNNSRKQAGLPEMDLFSIDLVIDQEDSLTNDETKMSSTAARRRDLGKLLRPVVRRPRSDVTNVYVIGLTGGIASGKSAIAKRLEKLGAEIIDADKLGHSAYEPGTEAYEEILKSFGREILDSDQTINRRRLGAIVFSDRERLRELNSIVWPKIMSKIRERITDAEERGCRVCVIEAALLLEAGWDEVVDEVWVSVVPASEAVTRMKDRNGITEEEAEKRLGSQMKNKDRVRRANVVLSTLWEPEYTQRQVEGAWNGLLERINQKVSVL